MHPICATCVLAGASGFEAQGMDPMGGTGAPTGNDGAAGKGGAGAGCWRFPLRGLLHAMTVEQFKRRGGRLHCEPRHHGQAGGLRRL